MQSSLAFCMLTPLLCGFASAWDTRSAVKSKWYQNVKKPWFNPPRYVFAPIWTYLYLSTGYALYLVQSSTTNQLSTEWGVYLFWSQLMANILWSNLYFVKRDLELAIADIILLLALSVAAMVCFFVVNPLAGLLMVPYTIWAAFAVALTLKVDKLNPNFKFSNE
ncbi:hypothetical protein DSO57_1001414 [Entomophthora muscae]|uniref:Uncharacterized protein n=2 Tax=Entomophthora muscae TaxID=34485 RepID=A0ACC2TK04_9FUNG|nr:hypothetical protein DSO57_1001413 [Entomophthora muscae]KAJ9074940.1 hypothetical protein DSO57_1001414 [Entomophthora muscae]